MTSNTEELSEYNERPKTPTSASEKSCTFSPVLHESSEQNVIIQKLCNETPPKRGPGIPTLKQPAPYRPSKKFLPSKSFVTTKQNPSQTPPSGAKSDLGSRSRSLEPNMKNRTGIPKSLKPENATDKSVSSEKSYSSNFSENAEVRSPVTSPIRKVAPILKPASNRQHGKAPNKVSSVSFLGIPLCIKTSGAVRVNSYLASNPVQIQSVSRSVTKSADLAIKKLEAQYSNKFKRFVGMKRDLLEKQKTAMEMFKTISDIRKRVMASEGKELPFENLRIVDFQPGTGTIVSGDESNVPKADPVKIQEVKIKVDNIPTACMDICRFLLKKRVNFIESIFNEKGEFSQDELIGKIHTFKEEMKKLELNVERKMKEQDKILADLLDEWNELLKASRAVIKEDPTIIDEMEKQMRDMDHKIKQTAQELQFEKSRKLKDNEKYKELERESVKLKDKVTELTKTLEEEKSRCSFHKERCHAAEQKMKTAKHKIKEAESIKLEKEHESDLLNTQLKKMEEQWMVKDVYQDNKIKELQKRNKEAEALAAKLEKERHAIDTRTEELITKLEEKDRYYYNIIESKTTQIEDLSQRLNEKEEINDELDTKYTFLKAQLTQMEANQRAFQELAAKEKKLSFEFAAESQEKQKTAGELELWKELQKTKDELMSANKKIDIYFLEKNRLIETMKQYEDKHLNLLAEKEQTITNVLLKNKFLEEINLKNSEDIDKMGATVKNLENQISTMNNESMKGSRSQVIDEYRNLLSEQQDSNAELHQKILKLEYDMSIANRTRIEHENLIKIRDDMLNILKQKKNFTANENDDLKNYAKHLKIELCQLHDEHDKKLEELHDLYCLLEKKETKLKTLEDKVAIMEKRFDFLLDKRIHLNDKTNELTNKVENLHDVIEHHNRYAPILNSVKFKNPSFIKRLQKSSLIIPKKNLSIKLKPKNYSTTGSVFRDKYLNRDYIQEILHEKNNISLDLQLYMNPLPCNKYQRDFIDHARTICYHKRNMSSCFPVSKFMKNGNRPFEIYHSDLANQFLHTKTHRAFTNFVNDIQIELNNALRKIVSENNINYSKMYT